MAVPDHRDIPQKLHATGLYDLKTKAGHDAYTDAVVSTLHGRDPSWRHLKKRSDQTHIHRHGEDSALYLLTDGTALAVDFIDGAGGPNPKPGWLVGTFPYAHTDAHDPTDHGIGGSSSTPPPVTEFPYLHEPTDGLAYQNRVKAAYNAVHRPFPDPNDADAFRNFLRLGYTHRHMPLPQAMDKHIAELRAELGAPPE